MTNQNKLNRFWQELKRRKVIAFIVAYFTFCIAVLPFIDGASKRLSISDKTVTLLYIIAAVGIPLAIILPWFIYRKNEVKLIDEPETIIEKVKPKHNLPAHLPGFIGREKEIETIQQLLSVNRLVTLTGAGGCGKTRLAIQTAVQALPDFSDGVWLVELAPVTVPDHINQAIAEIFKIKEQPGSTLIQIITHYLKSKKIPLILANS